MLRADEMMYAKYLSLKMAPGALYAVCMNEIVLHILASRVIDCMMIEDAAQAAIAAMLVSHDAGAGSNVLPDFGLHSRRAGVFDLVRAKLATSFQHPEDDRLIRATLA